MLISTSGTIDWHGVVQRVCTIVFEWGDPIGGTCKLSKGDPRSGDGFTIISEWRYSHKRSSELRRALSEGNFSSRVGTLTGGHSHSGGFRLPVANQEGACRLVLALPSLSGGQSYNRRFKHQGWIGDLDLDMLYFSSTI